MGQGLHPRDARSYSESWQDHFRDCRAEAPGGRGRPRAAARDAGTKRRALTRLLPGRPSHRSLLLHSCPGPGSGLAAPRLCLWAERERRLRGQEQLTASLAYRHAPALVLVTLSISTGGGRAGAETQALAPSALGRGWAAGGPLSLCPVSGSPDLEDMSVMILRTQGPDALFDDHKLVLHTSSADAERARVFHACGELMPVLPCPGDRGCSVSPPRPGCRLCSGFGAALRAQRRKHQMHEFHDWLRGVPGTAVPEMVSADECIFKYIVSTFKNFDYQNFQAYPEAERTLKSPYVPTTQIQQGSLFCYFASLT